MSKLFRYLPGTGDLANKYNNLEKRVTRLEYMIFGGGPPLPAGGSHVETLPEGKDLIDICSSAKFPEPYPPVSPPVIIKLGEE